MRILVIVNGRNCANYVQECMASLLNQTHKDFSVIVVDDASDDDTFHKLCESVGNVDFGITTPFIIRNDQRMGTALCRIKGELEAQAIGCQYDVVAWVDMDDYLLPNALEVIAKKYEDPECWLTYGNMIYMSTNKAAFSPIQLDKHPFLQWRKDGWKYVHLRTHRKGLINHLKIDQDVRPKEFEAYPDIHMLYCMLEMAGTHAHPIYAPLYVYRDKHPYTCMNQYSLAQRHAEKEKVKVLPIRKPLAQL